MDSGDESIWGPLIDGAQAGDRAAIDEMLVRANARLEILARKMLRDYPGVRRWEQTGDVMQEALVRLDRALRQAPPSDLRHFLRLAALQIRRTLIDLARKHQGPLGLAAHHESVFVAPDGEEAERERFVDPTKPDSLDDWTAFHEGVERLSHDEREVFQLLWYHGLTQGEAARLLEVDERTVRRRWLAARISLGKLLGGRTDDDADA